jgi:hypothetical protein
LFDVSSDRHWIDAAHAEASGLIERAYALRVLLLRILAVKNSNEAVLCPLILGADEPDPPKQNPARERKKMYRARSAREW